MHSKENSLEKKAKFKHTTFPFGNKDKLKWWCVWKRSLALFNSDKPSTQARKNSALGWFAQVCYLCSRVLSIACRQWCAWPKWQLVGFFGITVLGSASFCTDAQLAHNSSIENKPHHLHNCFLCCFLYKKIMSHYAHNESKWEPSWRDEKVERN